MSRGVLLALLLALPACGGEEAGGLREVPEGRLAQRSLLPSLFRCNYESSEDLVIRDTTAWATVWRKVAHEMAPPPRPPDVDFSKEMVLASFLGPGPAGRAVSIHVVERTGDRIVVTLAVRGAKEAGPGFGLRAGPCAMVAVPRSALEVEWRHVDSRRASRE